MGIGNTPEGRPVGFVAAVGFDGADARNFLQGQFCSDVHLLDGGGWQYSGLCNPKGRLIASFALVRAGENEYIALMARDIADDFYVHIAKYILRSEVKVGLRDDLAILFSPPGSDDRPSVENPVGIVKSDDDGLQLRGVGGTDMFLIPRTEAMPEAFDAEWMSFQIAAGIPWVLRQTREMFVAQSVNYDLLGGVSFKKGCFVGQEIIARMHYRGTPKQRMYMLHGDGAPPDSGAPVRSDRYVDQAAGHIVNSAPVSAHGGFVALACIRIDAAKDPVDVRDDGGLALQPREISY